MAANTVNTGTQVIPVVTPGFGERINDFFLSIAEWVDSVVASPASLDVYDKEVREHFSTHERAEIDARFLGL